MYEYTRTSEWLYKTTAEDSYFTTTRLGHHTSKRNAFVEENKSDIPDHSHPCLVTVQDGLAFPLTEHSVFHPPSPPTVHENITTENKESLLTSAKVMCCSDSSLDPLEGAAAHTHGS